MQKKPWRKLILLLLLAAALTYCVMAVNSVGNQLQYLIQAPAPEASGGGSESDEGQAEPMPNKEIMDQAEQLDSVMEGLSGNVSAYTLTGIVDQQSFQSDIGNGGWNCWEKPLSRCGRSICGMGGCFSPRS